MKPLVLLVFERASKFNRSIAQNIAQMLAGP